MSLIPQMWVMRRAIMIHTQLQQCDDRCSQAAKIEDKMSSPYN